MKIRKVLAWLILLSVFGLGFAHNVATGGLLYALFVPVASVLLAGLLLISFCWILED